MTDVMDRRVASLRRFNRFYTRRIGVLQEGLLQSPFSLTAVRVLYELAHREAPTATEIGKELGLDAGYLSRILRGFEKRGLIRREASPSDGRRSLLRLTPEGRDAFATLDARAHDEIADLLGSLSTAEQRRLLGATQTIERLLGSRTERTERPAYTLRGPRAGDMGWIVHRHGVLYAREEGYDERFEALVARIVADFVQRHDPKRERCWIAERDGEIVGSVFLMRKSQTVARLRLLIVEPAARGLGIGTRLVSESVRFARRAGYRRITLWTQQSLRAARRIYEQTGFRLVREEHHHSFGQDLIGETWELEL